MPKLTQDSVLQRIPSLKLSIDSSNQLKIFAEGKTIWIGSHGLAVLDVFSHPISVKEALKKLQNSTVGPQDWMDLMTTIVHLHEAGILREESQNMPILRSDGIGFDSAPIHVIMLNDRKRTTSFLEGIREVVRPGDVVIDIGTGTGILALAAAKAGAKHVYAIEASGIGKSARDLFEANGISDRISLIEGWSTQIELPERGNVLISEIIGNEPLGERVLETTSDAIKRLLRPEARLVPSHVRIYGLLVSIPSDELAKHTFSEEAVERWKSWYHFDFNTLRKVAQDSPHAFFMNPYLMKDWVRLGAPVLLAEIELKEVSELSIENKVMATVNASGRLNGIIEYFDLRLGPNTGLSTHPSEVDEACSWKSPIWILPDPLTVNSGEQLVVDYKYRRTAEHFKLSVSRPK